ncbi:TraB/GumN family protein [Flavobacterium beibuense]|uniref:GumN family protein n=1 Tax=Flavobacterium beibuense TaxID=657326 RepID=A0A444W5Y9_9FLAO|nr:TraB/GumN family protein [Flavobacterium beibuense]RYJ41284.1 GumN family protein [Flavobacterium beibuense]
MKKSALLLLLFTCIAFAQEKKYQSLLWEVSGNGLAKKSYLYGSMHVSDKVSYHLSDAFFEHLLDADMVANESEPSTWIDLYGALNPGSYRYNNEKFYSQFYLSPLTKDEMYPLFYMNNFTMNNLLFRTNEHQKEYQEETYLDMFIYRTGRKYNKKTVGLEDTKTSIINIMNADVSDTRPKEENMIALQKILKNNAYEDAMINFYRDKDLDMIDSLTVLSAPEGYLKALLYDRNVVMVKSIDSLARKGSLFAAVGAAHLPGKKGIIEMLRAKGYTVNPVFDSYTEQGKAKKQEIESYFIKPAYKNRTTPDGIISLPLHIAVIENEENLESPDLANGGYINVKRIPLLDFLKKDNKPFNHKSLDSLFYENIPGKILDKKFYKQDGYEIYDIKNVTKTGNAQHYRYYITPLEIIVVSMAGEEDYTRKFEEEVFNKIQLKPIASGWNTFTPNKGGFSVDAPSYTIVYGDRAVSKTVSDIEMLSYAPEDNAHYFILERTLSDNQTLENSDFELKRIQYEFYNQFDIDSTQTKSTKTPLSFTSSSKIGNKTIELKTFLNGAKYYLMGTVGASEENTKRFFSSFNFQPAKSQTEFREFKDTISGFVVDIPKLQNERLDFVSKKPQRYGNDKVNEFQIKNSNYSFTLPSGQAVSVWYHQDHKYRKATPIDSLWTKLRERVISDDEIDEDKTYTLEDIYKNKNNNHGGYYGTNSDYKTAWDIILSKDPEVKHKTTIRNEKTSHDESTDTYRMDAIAVDSNSEQALKYTYINRDNERYLIRTLVNKDYNGEDTDIEKIFSSFRLTKKQSNDINKNKVSLFIEDAKSSHDSIRYSALQSVSNLSVEKEDLPVLENFINTFDFKKDETEALTELYEKIGELDDKRAIAFLEKQYKKENTNTIIQFAVLNALTNQYSEEGYKKILELMEYDLPVSDNGYEIKSLFRYFESDMENSNVLFPDIFQFYSINEYHEPILNFTSALLSSETVKAKKLKNFKKMILTNAKLELKRVKSRKAKQEMKEQYNGTPETKELLDYITLLYPFKGDSDVKAFFESIKKTNIKQANLAVSKLNIDNGIVDKNELTELLKDKETLFLTYNRLYKKEPGLIKNISHQEVAASALFSLKNMKSKEDSLVFIEKRIVPVYSHKAEFYFFKIQNISEDKDPYDYNPDKITGIAFIQEDNTINPAAYKIMASKVIIDEDELENNMKEMIDSIINGDKTRASFTKEDDYNRMPYSDYDYDY